MKFSKINAILVVLISVVIFISCTESAIPYDLTEPDLNIDTLTVKAIKGGTYLSPPNLGNTQGLYFGEKDGFDNLFSLVQFSSISLNNTVIAYSLLDSSVTIDSVVVSFTATKDTLLTDSQFELLYFPAHGDSVFSESESHYLNLNENDVAGAELIGSSVFIQDVPDSTESIYPKLNFNIEDIESFIGFLADTTDNKNRTFMLKNIEQIDDIASIRSREAITDVPTINVFYRVGEDTLHNIFYPTKDITIVTPRPITDTDQNYISVGRSTGLKSVLQFDFTGLDIDSSAMVIKSANLIFNSLQDVDEDDLRIEAAILEDSLSISDFWEIDEDEYIVKSGDAIIGEFKNYQMKMGIRSFIQGINTGSYNNYGLKLYSTLNSDPFKTVNLILDPNDAENAPYIQIVYVKL